MKIRPFLLLTLIIVHAVSILAQTGDIVKTEGITSTLHRDNMGKIYFTASSITLDKLKSTDFLQSYTLTNKSNLFFIAFMGNSITNYLHQLDSTLSSDSLNKIGNYQFTILIDGKTIYQSNLFPGAPYPRIQDSTTVINKALINNDNSNGIWSESFWNRFMRFGGDSALTDGKHLLRMEIRPYLKGKTTIVGNIIAAGNLNLMVARKPVIDTKSIHLNQIQPYNGFEPSKEIFDTQKIKELKGSIEEGLFKKINSIVVIKKGKLLLEEYFNGETRFTLHDPRSVGKSFASTIAGIALHEKHLRSENQLVKDFYNLHSYKNYTAEKEQVTLKDLLTMSSSFDGNDEEENSPGNEENMYPTNDWVKFTLDLPTRDDAAKKNWRYFTAGVILIGDILNKTVPGGLEKYAEEKLFKPLGITQYKWQYTPQQVPNTAGSIQMSALDFAKYGQLYKNEGRWNGKQILPKAWVLKTFTKQKKIEGRDDEYYGYLFWNKVFRTKQKTYEAFYCAGNGGNYIIVLKDQPVVIVITASAYGQSYAHSQVNKMLTDFILPSILE